MRATVRKVVITGTPCCLPPSRCRPARVTPPPKSPAKI